MGNILRMDHHADSDSCQERLRTIEPILFFAGVVCAVASAIALVTWEATCVPIGPTDRAPVADHAY